MNKHLFIGLAVLTLGSSTPAALYSPYWDGINVAIPDASASGYRNSQTVSGIPQTVIQDVNVTLNISGGFNGDLYVYLSHGSGMAVLLNQVGRGSSSGVGYGNAGFGPDGSANLFTLDDDLGNDVHRYQTYTYSLVSGHLTGTWQPDGRDIDPLAPRGDFETAGRGSMLSSFDGGNPNGTWTLFFADLSTGNQSTLVGWGLGITAVPEPVSVALALFGGALGVTQLVRFLRRRKARYGA
jgi:subtilisin-like proprotein convertase family protein